MQRMKPKQLQPKPIQQKENTQEQPQKEQTKKRERTKEREPKQSKQMQQPKKPNGPKKPKQKPQPQPQPQPMKQMKQMKQMQKMQQMQQQMQQKMKPKENQPKKKRMKRKQIKPRSTMNRTTGVQELLVIRVQGRHDRAKLTASEDQLFDDIFDDDVNVAKQYAACSGGKLVLKPASSELSPNIHNGIVTVVLKTVIGRSTEDILDEIETISQTTNFFGKELGAFDKVMVCMPKGTLARGKEDWLAFAPGKLPYIHYMTFYNDEWCSSVSAAMHEIGHNLGLQHAGESNAYDDESGQMGYSSQTELGPKKCFNPAKSWQLGWYTDRSLRMNPSMDAPMMAVLTGLGYTNEKSSSTRVLDNDPPSLVLLQVANGDSDLHIGYNRKKGFNSGTEEGADQLLITEQKPGGLQPSQLLAKLDEGDSFIVQNYLGTRGKHLVIFFSRKQSRNDEAVVRVFFRFDDPSQQKEFQTRPRTGGCSQAKVRFEALLVTDNRPQETSWELIDNRNGQLVASRGSLDRQALTASTAYRDTVCVEPGISYTFTVKDTQSDGMCCDDGYGAYFGFVEGREVFRGGEFRNVELVRHRFVVENTRLNSMTGLAEPKVLGPRVESNQKIAPKHRTDSTATGSIIPSPPPKDSCVDSPIFRFDGEDHKSCALWVADLYESPKIRWMRCRKIDPITNHRVREFCPSLCKRSCRLQQEAQLEQTEQLEVPIDVQEQEQEQEVEQSEQFESPIEEQEEGQEEEPREEDHQHQYIEQESQE